MTFRKDIISLICSLFFCKMGGRGGGERVVQVFRWCSPQRFMVRIEWLHPTWAQAWLLTNWWYQLQFLFFSFKAVQVFCTEWATC